MSETLQHHRLKPANVGHFGRILIPDDWDVGRLPDGRWWCGPTDDDITLFLQSEVVEGLSPDPHANIVALRDQTVEFLESQDPVAPVTVVAAPFGEIVTAELDHAEGPVMYRTYRWYIITATEWQGAIGRFILSLPRARATAPAVQELVRLLEGQVAQAQLTLCDDGGLEQPLHSRVFWEVLAMDVPADWCWEFPDGRAWYGRPPGPGGVEMSLQLMRTEELAGDQRDRVARSLDRVLAHYWEELPEALGQPVDPPLREDLPDGCLEQGTFRDPDTGVHLVVWQRTWPFGSRQILLTALLAVPPGDLDEPAMAELVAIFTQCVAEARIVGV